MKSFSSKSIDNPEKRIQVAIEEMLRLKQWFVQRMHGNLFQYGLPDIFASHKIHGHRWIEVKLPGMKGSRFTVAQIETFPLLCSNGSGVWILTSDHPNDYDKLFRACNWWTYVSHYKI